MISEERNQVFTRVGVDTPMGKLLRRYWHPIAGASEFETRSTKPVRLLGEDLVLYKDLSGNFGLINRRCAHRGVDLSYAAVEKCGIRCFYHGWRYDETGACVEQPYEDVVHPEHKMRGKIQLKAYPVQLKAGLVWAYMGPNPAPQLPDWEPFSWANGFTQIAISEVPCNWLQCQENSIDPVHFEWMHENWSQRLRGENGPYGPKHLQLDFEEFEHGFVYKRIREGEENHENWTVGRTCLWPNAFYLGEHFEWRVPIDDMNTLSICWKYTRVPKEQEPYVQKRIPTWIGPVFNADGSFITTHVMNQDFLGWVAQGGIADRTNEHLGASDRGIAMIRRRFLQELEALEAGRELKGIIRDPAINRRVALPVADRDLIAGSHTRAQILANPTMRFLHTTYFLQTGQPEWVRREFAEAMGWEASEFTDLRALHANGDSPTVAP